MARPRSNTLPTIEVSSEDWSTKSIIFWKKTETLMNELEELRRDTQAIFCPCNKPDCPFTAENGKSNSPTKSTTCLNRSFKTHSIPRARKAGTYNGFTHVREDCEVDLEGTLSCSDYIFSRSGPSRKGRRNHTSLTQSLSLTSGSQSRYLKPPPPPLSPASQNLYERSTSLPSISSWHPVHVVDVMNSRGTVQKSVHLSHSRLIMPSA